MGDVNSPQESSKRDSERHRHGKSNDSRSRHHKEKRRDEHKRKYNEKTHSDNHRKRDRSRSNSPIRNIRIKNEPESDANNSENHRRENNRHGRRRGGHRQGGGQGRRASDRHNRNGEEQNYEWGKPSDNVKKEEENVEEDKQKPQFGLSGKLAEDTNKVNGVVIKYNEPEEARKPKRRWRLYPFKGEESLPFIPIHRQSAYLLGRERHLCDIPTHHPSCSKQHAVLQFRLVDYKRDNGSTGKRVRPYIIDLESSNGTFVNNAQIESKRYVELFEQDVLKFGYSTREYVVLHENSVDEVDDDDIAPSSPTS